MYGKHVQSEKLRHFGRYEAKAKLLCQKFCLPIWEKFHPGYRDLDQFRFWASRFSYENKEIITRKRVIHEATEISETEPPRSL